MPATKRRIRKDPEARETPDKAPARAPVRGNPVPDRAAQYDALKARIQPVHELESFLKVLFYGRSGTGKTTVAASFPKPMLFLDIREKGTDSIADVSGVDVLSVNSWDDVEMVYWMLKAKAADYNTVVVDSISMAQNLFVDELLEKEGRDAMSKQMWGEVSGKMQTTVVGFRDLPTNVVFIAHDRTRTSDEEGDESIEPEVGPALIPSVAKVVNGAVGIIGNTYIAERKIQKGPKVTRRIEYRMRLGPHPFYTTKVRSPQDKVAPPFIVNPSYDDLLAITKGTYNAKTA